MHSNISWNRWPQSRPDFNLRQRRGNASRLREDPRATRKVLELQQETRRLNQYNENIDLSSEKLNSVYGAIQALKKVSDRAGELAAMVDDMKSKDQLAAYRQEVNQLIEQSVQIGNTNNQFGYIFGGTRSNTEAYNVTRNENGEISGVEYQGSTQTVGIEIAKGSQISVEMPGSNTTESGTLVCLKLERAVFLGT